MKKLTLSVLFCLVTAPALAAPSLHWDAVTTDTDNNPLAPGMEVKEYRVYGCTTGSTCSKGSGVLVATVPAPATSMDLAGKNIPQTYAVTAVNILGESADSLPLKVTPADKPKNLKVRP